MVIDAWTVILGEPNTLPSIDGIYAFLSKDDQGNEGLCACQFRKGYWVPLVTTDLKQVEKLAPIAEAIVQSSKHDVVLVKFNNREEIKRFTKESKDETRVAG